MAIEFYFMKYFSQDKQDYIIDSIFNKKDKGFFIDIGAHDGVTFSNTYFLEKERKWKGICIEPIPEVYTILQRNRNCIMVNGAISTIENKMKFIRGKGYVEMLSGLVDFYDERHIQRVERDIKKYGGSYEIIEVKCYNLNNLLIKYDVKDVDYCNIDVEGAELEILRSINFRKCNFKAFSIECNYSNNEVKEFMKSKGYFLLCMSGADGIFLKRNQFSLIINLNIVKLFLRDRIGRNKLLKKIQKKLK